MKMGEYINGNHNTKSPAGKNLIKMINKRKLGLHNRNYKCQGLWTCIKTTDPENQDRKSILDYVNVNKKCLPKIKTCKSTRKETMF